jgi:ketosteroid isomerase-like protein
MSHTATVQSLYEAFGRGDVPAILEYLAEDVAWERWDSPLSAAEAGIPYLQPRTGRAEVTGFFEALGGLEFHAFETYAFLESGDKVAVQVRIDVTVKGSGKRVQDDEVHLWTFNAAGKVAAFRHYADTGKHIAAHS